MVTRHGDLVARRLDGELEIGNSRIRARFVRRDGGYAQEFYARDRAGDLKLVLSSLHKDLIPGSEHRVCSSPIISGDRPHLFAVCRDSLRMAFSAVDLVRHDDETVTARLSGTVQNHSLTCCISIARGSNVAYVTIADEIRSNGSDPLVEYLMSSYAFLPDGRELRVGETIDFAWAPNLRPGDDHVIGDRAFHSPAVIVQKGRTAAALIPDLDALSAHRPMPFALDLDLNNGLLPAPLLSCGFCGYEETADGRYFRHDITMAQRIPGARLGYGYHLILDADCKPFSAQELAARFLWTRYGRATMNAAGRTANSPESDSLSGASVVLPPDAWAACGLYADGVNRGSDVTIHSARALKEAVLAAAQICGMPLTGRECPASSGLLYTAEWSRQFIWLLRWHTQIESDSRIIQCARNYADFLISTRHRNGAIPSRIGPDPAALSASNTGIATAVSALFLARLASVTGLARYRRAAERSAWFVLTEIVPRYGYADDSPISSEDGAAVGLDPHSGANAQDGWAMLWVAQMCFELHRLTRDRNYIAHGLAALDQLCLLQSVGAKAWLSASGKPGMCVTSNVGALFDAELTAEFARCAMDYGAMTGESEYFERGAAALAAAIAEPGLSVPTRARIAASAAAIRDRYGSAYVHIGRRWGVSIAAAARLEVAFGRGSVRVKLNGGTNGSHNGKVVFGAMRGSRYKLRIGDLVNDSYTRQDMERGIALPTSVTAGPTSAANTRPARQLTLERM